MSRVEELHPPPDEAGHEELHPPPDEAGHGEIHPPPDEAGHEEGGGKDSEEESDDKSKDSSSISADSETTSLTGSGNWTILEKEEVENLKESETSKEEEANCSHGVAVEDVFPAASSKVEDDSESIETISDDESLVSASLSESLHANLASFCYIPDSTDSGFTGSSEPNSQQMSTVSLLSTFSNQSVVSDGIPIVDHDTSPMDDGQAQQYEWNNMEGARVMEDGSQDELSPENEEVGDHEDQEEEEINDQLIEEDEAESDDNTTEENSERRARGEDSEPGYDLDDDGLPGAPLPPLNQEVELYPSQELDENFQVIERGKVYKHEYNLKLDHILTAILVLALALVVGLGIGHFLGLSERLEVQEMYEQIQVEKLDNLQDDLVSCMEGEEGRGGDDQDLDDRVIRQLWDENQDLKDQVQVMKATIGDPGDEAMAAILREKINELLTANADLQREVVRLRYADAAREAAESVETLDKLRKTRDTLNDIVTENDQLKLEVAKARYGEPPVDKNSKAERDSLVEENKDLKQELETLKNSFDNGKTLEFESFSENPQAADIDEDILLNNPLKKDDLNTPWPSRRHEELKIDEELEKEETPSVDEIYEDEIEEEDDDEDEIEDEDDDEDEEEIKNESMNNLSKYLSSLVKMFGVKIVSKDGSIDWDQAKKFMDGLKEDLTSRFDEAGNMAKEEIHTIISKFEDLKTFVNTGNVNENIKATQTAAKKLVKSLVDAVDDLRDASEDAAEKSEWFKIFQFEASKVKSTLENRWTQIKEKWQTIIEDGDNSKNENSYNREKNHANKEDKYERKKSRKGKVAGFGTEEDEDEGYQSSGDVKKKMYKRSKNEEREATNEHESHHKYEDNRLKERKHHRRTEYDEEKRTPRTEKDEGYRSSGERDKHSIKDRSQKRGEQRRVSQGERRSFGSRKPTGEEIKNRDWLWKRGEQREKNRREDGNSDWIFERAKHRKDIRKEESRGDWYFERKENKDESEYREYPQSRRSPCDKDDWDCRRSFGHQDTEFGRKQARERGEQKERGEKYANKKQETGRTREKRRGDSDRDPFGDFSHFNNEVKFAERNYERDNKQYKRSHDRKKVLKNDVEDSHEDSWLGCPGFG